MINIIIGGVGSGKTLMTVKSIIDSKKFVYTNFNLKNMRGKYKRIKIDDIISHTKEDKKDLYSVNWDFWKKARKEHKHFSIYLDEVHNIISSRRFMSKRNILMSRWLSQIRKITSDSEHNDLFLISQTLRKIDVDFRELAHNIIQCHKIQENPTKILLRSYSGLDNYENNIPSFKYWFKGDDYFKYYDSLEMINFGDEEEFI